MLQDVFCSEGFLFHLCDINFMSILNKIYAGIRYTCKVYTALGIKNINIETPKYAHKSTLEHRFN